MHPANVGCLTAAGIDCDVLANNHVLGWGRDGLAETRATLHAAGPATAGAGRDAYEAAAPAVLDVPGRGRVPVFACATRDSGVPTDWASTAQRSGVNLLAELSAEAVDVVARRAIDVAGADVVHRHFSRPSTWRAARSHASRSARRGCATSVRSAQRGATRSGPPPRWSARAADSARPWSGCPTGTSRCAGT
jgi:hypothetical protein